MLARQDELREWIPVPRGNYLKFVNSLHSSCEGYFYLLFPCQQSKLTWRYSYRPIRCRPQNNHAEWHRTKNRVQIIGRCPCMGDSLPSFILSWLGVSVTFTFRITLGSVYVSCIQQVAIQKAALSKIRDLSPYTTSFLVLVLCLDFSGVCFFSYDS